MEKKQFPNNKNNKINKNKILIKMNKDIMVKKNQIQYKVNLIMKIL